MQNISRWNFQYCAVNNSGKSRHNFLAIDHSGKASILSQLVLCWYWFFTKSLSLCCRLFFLLLSCIWLLTWNGVEFYQMLSLQLLRRSYSFCSSSCLDGVPYLLICMSWIISAGSSGRMIHLIYCQILLTSILWRSFESMFIRDIFL